METVLNMVAPIFAGLCVLGALYLLIRGLRSRGVPQTSYGVARQEARQSMLLSFFGAVILLIVGVLIFSIYGLFSGDLFSEASGNEPVETFTPSPTVMVTEASIEATMEPVDDQMTADPINTPVDFENLATPTFTPEIPTATPQPTNTPTPQTPTATSTPVVETAVVNSPNGLWLREAPGGTQEVELIPDGTVLTVLAGKETVDDLEWQQVRTPAGNEGWVAVDFLIYQ